MYVCSSILISSCNSADLTSSKDITPKLEYSIIPTSGNGPNKAGFIHKYGLLYLNEKISYTYKDSSWLTIKNEFSRLANEFAVDSLDLSGESLENFNNAFAHGISLFDSLQHGEISSSSRLSYYMDTALYLTAKQKYYIQRMYNVSIQDLTRSQTSDSIDSQIWVQIKSETWMPGERKIPEYYYYIISTSNEIWKFFDEEAYHTKESPKKPLKSLPHLSADTLGALGAIARAFGAGEGMPSDNEIGGEALGASVGVAIGGLLGGGAGAAAGGLIGAFLGGAASGSGTGRPSPGWNPNEGFPRDNTYVYVKRP